MKEEDDDEKSKPVDHPHVAAMEALTFFVSKYEPAGLHDADTFYTTKEINQAVEDHTGMRLQDFEVYQLMKQMNYEYAAINGLEFNWLLKSE